MSDPRAQELLKRNDKKYEPPVWFENKLLINIFIVVKFKPLCQRFTVEIAGLQLIATYHEN